MTPYFTDSHVTLYHGDCCEIMRQLPEQSVHCCVSSPPYWGLRRYLPDGHPDKDSEIGLEETPEAYIARMVAVYREVWRVLRDDGVIFVNLGDSYARDGGASGHGNPLLNMEGKQHRMTSIPDGCGLKPKDLCGIPWRVAFALQADGWTLRSDIPWVKRSAMPEPTSDRPNKALEYVFLLTKQPRYFFDMDAIRKPNSEATLNRDRYTRVVENDGPQAVRHDHETAANPAGRNFRNCDLWFESIEKPHGLVGIGDELVGLDATTNSYKGAHFATFSPALIEPFIKAGTSEHGCCPECGAPWTRVVDATKYTPESSTTRNVDASRGDKTRKLSGPEYNRQVKRKTIGWQPSCKCDAGEPIPCTVLDPFSGSATTSAVSRDLGRRSIGIELNQDYLELSKKRFTQRVLC